MAALCLGLGLAACAAPGAGAGADGAAPPSVTTGTGATGTGATGTTDAAASRPVLQVRMLGGFVPVGYEVARLPAITVYADGRVVGEGPEPAIGPGGAVPNLVERRIGTDQVGSLVARAVAAGALERTDLGRPAVADATTTRITVVTPGGTADRDVYALLEGTAAPGGPLPGGLTPEQAADRARLRAFVRSLTPGDEAPGAGPLAGQWRPYPADRVAAVVRPATAPDARRPAPASLPWPGPPLPGPAVSPGASCVLATGGSAAAVLAAARTASVATRWTTSDGRTWQVLLRPLLPAERSCADLAVG